MIYGLSGKKRRAARLHGLKIGMGLCAGLMLFACNSSTQTDADNTFGVVRLGDSVVVTVNDSAIYASDITEAAVIKGHINNGELLRPDHQHYKTVLESLIDQRLLAQSAKAQDLHKRSDAKRRMATAQERILGNIIVEEHLAATVNDEAARKLYDAQMTLRETSQEARASHILVESKAEADAVIKRLEGGEEFAQIAFDVSIDQGTRADGGDLGYFQEDAMVAPFAKAVFALQKDEVSVPFESQFGWHIAKLIDLRAAPKPSFEAMRDQMINFLTYDEIKQLLEDLRGEAEISYTRAPPNETALDEPDVNSGVDEDETSNQ